MANLLNVNKKRVVVPAGKVKEYYPEGSPNYFRISNLGANSVYASTDRIPTTTDFDVKVEGSKMRAYGEPHRRKVIYIYNPSSVDIVVSVLSFYAEYDPLMLALDTLEVEVGGTISGEVTVTNQVNYGTDIQLLRQYMANMVGTTSLDSQYGLIDLFYLIKELRKAVTGQTGIVNHVSRSNSTFTKTCDETHYIDKVQVFVNDGTTDINLCWDDMNSGGHSFTVKAGESLDNFTVAAKKIYTTTGTFRLSYMERELV